MKAMTAPERHADRDPAARGQRERRQAALPQVAAVPIAAASATL